MGMGRRAFIGLVVGGTAGTLLTPIPWKLTDDASIWSQNWPWIPRVPSGDFELKPSLSKLDNSGVGVNVVTVKGKPCAVYGNPEHPLSRGGISSLAVNEAEFLYSPSRVQSPLKREGNNLTPISWDDAKAMLAEKLKAAGADVACVSGDDTGSGTDVFSAFVAAAGSKLCFYMPAEQVDAGRAWLRLGGQGMVGYDIENADLVLAIGADIFESWGTHVRNAEAFNAAHPMGGEPTMSVVYASPVKNRGAAVADAWVPVLPGSEAALALGIAYHLIQGGATNGGPGFEAFRSAVMSGYSPDKVQQATGLTSEQVADLAKRLASAKRPLVIAGSSFGQGGGQNAVAAGLALNLLLGRLNKAGGIYALPEAPAVVQGAMPRQQILANDFVDYMLKVGAGETKAPAVLLAYEANPAYALPQTELVAQALDKVGFLVSFSSFMDETAAIADLVLPTPLVMERMEDMYTPYGSGWVNYTVANPVIAPVFGAVPAADVLLQLASGLGYDLGFGSFEDVVKAKADALSAMGGFVASAKAEPWKVRAGGGAPSASGVSDAVQAGKAWVSMATANESGLSLAKAAAGQAAAPEGGEFPLVLAPLFELNVGSAKIAIPPHNVSTIRHTESANGNFYVRMNSATASKYGVSQGKQVTVASKTGSIKALVQIDEGVMDGVVAAPLGFGHTAWDKFAQNKGDNVSKVLTVATEPGVTAPFWAGSMVKIA
jgi:anaerobic selenocysteine-containing dehydrogenase